MLLYAIESKEVIQRKIEEYLINKQNIYILNKVSSTTINYSLITRNVVSKIIEYIEGLKILYQHSLNLDILPNDSKYNKILSEASSRS